MDCTIDEIERLDDKHRITDKSQIVEFDYRCKIEEQYVIIDMQQWYKPDISQRFYIYHSLNASLQLEDLRDKAVPVQLKILKEQRVTKLKRSKTID